MNVEGKNMITKVPMKKGMRMANRTIRFTCTEVGEDLADPSKINEPESDMLWESAPNIRQTYIPA